MKVPTQYYINVTISTITSVGDNIVIINHYSYVMFILGFICFGHQFLRNQEIMKVVMADDIDIGNFFSDILTVRILPKMI